MAKKIIVTAFMARRRAGFAFGAGENTITLPDDEDKANAIRTQIAADPVLSYRDADEPTDTPAGDDKAKADEEAKAKSDEEAKAKAKADEEAKAKAKADEEAKAKTGTQKTTRAKN